MVFIYISATMENILGKIEFIKNPDSRNTIDLIRENTPIFSGTQYLIDILENNLPYGKIIKIISLHFFDY